MENSEYICGYEEVGKWICRVKRKEKGKEVDG